MKNCFRKAWSLLLALALVSTLTLPAAASEALGEDLAGREIVLNEETRLSTNVFWSTAYSDLRRENLITYIPNKDVTPIVTFGGVLTQRSTVTAAARELEKQGYRVVAGINGDFYNVGTGLPIGIVVTEGQLRSSDAGYYAIGFRKDGNAILGKPVVKVTADLGYGVDDGFGNQTQYVRTIAGVNKARVSTGGIYLYTYDFNDRHTTGNTEPGIDVVCSIEDGEIAIGETVTLRVEQVLEAAKATDIRPDQVVLSVNLKSDAYHVDVLRGLSEGGEITLQFTPADEAWADVEYAVGALYALVENGQVVSGLQAGANPRTAVGQKADGTLIFYTIDGRRSGHSIGASMEQVAKRLIELGCETAVCLDGGGSTTMSVTEPDELEAKAVNTPSGGSERAVTNQVFLVADGEPTGRLSHFYVNPDNTYVLAGSKVNISAAAVDTNYIPMEEDCELSASDGELDGHVLTTPSGGGEITVTARQGGKKGSAVVYAIETPDDVAIRNGSGTILTELAVTPGSTTTLTATAAYRHLPLKADPECFTWTVSGEIGTVDEKGVFTAGTPGQGTITVSAGGKSASVAVTVSRLALKTVEDFEQKETVFSGGSGSGLSIQRERTADLVRMGRSSGRLTYALEGTDDRTARWNLDQPITVSPNVYSSLTLWVYGDQSGNTLSFVCSDAEGGERIVPAALLDFKGWKQVSVELGTGFAVSGLQISGPEPLIYDDGMGNMIEEYPDSVLNGTLYLDQMVASFGGAVDQTPPEVKLSVQDTKLTASITDQVDGTLPESAVSVTWDGAKQDFSYNAASGALSTSLISDGRPHRITVTARDASGNIGRASYDVPVAGDYQLSFTDTQGYWGANYVEFLYTSGITTGYSDGSFRPGQNITRAQFSVMLYRYLGLDASQYEDVKLPFADSSKIADYAVPAVKALYTEGVINGTTGKDGQLYFNPNDSLTRAQAATMIGRTQTKGYALAELNFTDAGKIPAYAAFYIRTMAAQGVIGGYSDGSFKPNSPITRGQMAKILYNLM
jgi:hypothetical protein